MQDYSNILSILRQKKEATLLGQPLLYFCGQGPACALCATAWQAELMFSYASILLRFAPDEPRSILSLAR